MNGKVVLDQKNRISEQIITLDSAPIRYLKGRDYRLSRLMNAIDPIVDTYTKTAFENLIRSIIEQMLSINVANALEIGSWTAHMFMLFHLKRPDILPISDLTFKSF